MSIEYHNLMEDIVLQEVDDIMRSGGGCCCDICKTDVIAYALNHLPPHYVATHKGRMMDKLQSYQTQSHADVIAALSEAAQLVARNPRHEDKD